MFIYSNGRVDSRKIGNLGEEKKDQAAKFNVLFFSMIGLNNILPKSQIILVTTEEIV